MLPSTPPPRPARAPCAPWVAVAALASVLLGTAGAPRDTTAAGSAPNGCSEASHAGYRYEWCRGVALLQYHSSSPVSIGRFAGESVAKGAAGAIPKQHARDLARSVPREVLQRAVEAAAAGVSAARGSDVAPAGLPDDLAAALPQAALSSRLETFDGGDPCADTRRTGSVVEVTLPESFLGFPEAGCGSSGPTTANGGNGEAAETAQQPSEIEEGVVWSALVYVAENTPCKYSAYALRFVAGGGGGTGEGGGGGGGGECPAGGAAEGAGGGGGGGGGPARGILEKEESEITSQDVRGMFDHGMAGYMAHAHPLPDLRPLTCDGVGFSFVNVPALTLIDSLDTFVVMRDLDGFRKGVADVIAALPDKFDMDANVSVFETTIRVLGGLLSSHLLAAYGGELVDYVASSATPELVPGYRGELLDLAVDIGTRIAPAFETSNGIPYGTINLRHGVPEGETTVASLAGAGSLSIEFTVLAIAANDTKFLRYGNTAALQLFKRRSFIGLLGKHLDFATQEWTEYGSGIGTNSDSFYEYLLKGYLLNPALDANWQAYDETYEAVMAYVADGDFYADVHMASGQVQRQEIEGLSAFWPALQVLTGEHEHAARTLNAMFHIVDRVGFLPEGFFYNDAGGFSAVSTPTDRSYLLRPELIESVMYLAHATRDDSWLVPIRQFIHGLEDRCKTQCGYASLEQLTAEPWEGQMQHSGISFSIGIGGKLSMKFGGDSDGGKGASGKAGKGDRPKQQRAAFAGVKSNSMQSFFLSETLKYLYIILEDAEERAAGSRGSWLLDGAEEWIFSTEAHMFPIRKLQGMMSREFLEASRNLSRQTAWEWDERPASHPECPADQLWVKSYDPEYAPVIGGAGIGMPQKVQQAAQHLNLKDLLNLR